VSGNILENVYREILFIVLVMDVITSSPKFLSGMEVKTVYVSEVFRALCKEVVLCRWLCHNLKNGWFF